MAAQRVAVVTGANKGLGLAIVRNLALRFASSKLSKPDAFGSSKPLPFTLYLAARDAARGHAAVESINNDQELVNSKVLTQNGGPTQVVFKRLDVTDNRGIEAFAKSLAEDHEEFGLDVLVNNAGISIGGAPNAEAAKVTVATNFTGLVAVTQRLLPLLSKSSNGRIVNISSMLGKLSTPKFSPEIMSRYSEATSIDDITRLMEEYQKSVNAGTWERDGWPGSPYAVSKAAVTATTLLLGRRPQLVAEMLKQANYNAGATKERRKLLINACCPGYVKTDLTKGRGRRTPDQGAKTPVLLALDDIRAISGEFWENEEVSSWFADGKPDLRRSKSS